MLQLTMYAHTLVFLPLSNIIYKTAFHKLYMHDLKKGAYIMDEFNHNCNRPPNDGEQQKRINLRDEEYAAEMTAENHYRSQQRNETISTYGWIGLALSIISFFMWPILFGISGIILGFVSRSKGADTLGNLAIAAGIISVFFAFFVRPFLS